MITVHELTKRFSSGSDEITAVDRLTFRVAGGEVYGLLGPNGAGKTTTLRMILGLLRPDAGWAEVAGFRTSVAPDEVKRRIGFVSATAGLYQWLTARELLLFFADIYGVAPSAARQELVRVTEALDLADFLDRRCGGLSTGQRQRVNLARAMIHNPPIMLLDEPTRGLDVLGSQEMFEYINRLRGENKAVIVTTHRLDEAERLCDRFGLLHRGRLAGEGTLDELREATGCQSLAEIFLKRMSPREPALTTKAEEGAS
ncbi:MAG: ATP-binding cassette domain-containing protein [Planctomycetes bacterium]|nr:ATP-binding cassette domain-containing protein [Planctomycetota bacterium]